jgi:hypothetical protein
MIDIRPQADRMQVAQLPWDTRHRARWREVNSDEEAVAVAELRALAGGRADLLADVAGIEGAPEGELDEPLSRCAAMLGRKARADPEAIPRWAPSVVGGGKPRGCRLPRVARLDGRYGLR